MNRYTKYTAVTNIRDYYNPPPVPSVNQQQQAFELAKAQYIEVLRNQIVTAEQIKFIDVFPKSSHL